MQIFFNKYKRVLILLALGMASISGVWYLLTPHNYEDCILKYLKPNASDFTANQIRGVCHNKFDTPQRPTSICKDIAYDRQSFPASARIYNEYNRNKIEVTLHNNVKDIEVTSITAFVQINDRQREDYKLTPPYPISSARSLSTTTFHPESLTYSGAIKDRDWGITNLQICKI